jgi:hypothetical protein
LKIHKGLTKQDHITIVGGLGKSLDRNCHHWIVNDLNFIAERTSNTLWDLSSSLRASTRYGWEGELGEWFYGFIGPWRRMICITLVLQTHHLLQGKIAHTTHRLHLISRGNNSLTQLIADSFVGGKASGIIITHSRVSPFITKIQKHRGAWHILNVVLQSFKVTDSMPNLATQ